MSLRYGILGLLSKWEASGYDIKKEFDEIMNIFWHSHLSQIYPELRKMEKENLISSKRIPQDGKPDKKIYSITEEGKKELFNWLLSVPEPPKVKDPFLMQAFFMDNIPFDQLIFNLQAYKKERQQRLNKMQKIVQERWASIQKRDEIRARIIMSSAVVKRGIQQEIEYIKWCEDTIKFVEKCRHLWEDQHSDQENDSNKQHTSSSPYTKMEDIFLQYFEDI